MIIFFLLSLGVVVLWAYGSVGWFSTMMPINYVWLDYPFQFLLDDVSLVCSYMLLCCGVIALFYCFHYFGYTMDGSSLFILIVWFLSVMSILIFSSSMIFSLFLWEYLGLVSFFLILFYSNGVSLRASLVTLFASRFGDVGLFMLILWVTNQWFLVGGGGYILFLLLVVLTKSACYPFISWLLEAMRAPTPVSSLVHSSTLVAAGVWFLLRYDNLFSISSCGLLLGFSLLTILVTGVCACFFVDLKKIVALSTCNNISWCLLFFICGDISLCLLQLLTHGVCKCYLFMSVGDLMSSSSGSQSSVGVYMGRYSGVYGVVSQLVLILSLCGLPFIGVFFSKHAFFSGLTYIYGGGFLSLLLLCFFVSHAYSVRFAILLLRLGGGLSCGYSSGFMLVAVTSFLGTVLNFMGGIILSEILSLGSVWSSLLLLLQLSGCVLGYLLYAGGYSGKLWESTLWGGDCLVSGVYTSFLGFSQGCLLAIYRWELYLVGLLSLPSSMGSLRGHFFSINFLVCGLLFCLFLHFFVGF